MCLICTTEKRYVHHQHADDYDEAHAADMRALRLEQLAADIGPEDMEEFDNSSFGKCVQCGYAVMSDGTCLCPDDTFEEAFEDTYDDDLELYRLQQIETSEARGPWACLTCTTENEPEAKRCQCCGVEV